MCLRERWRAARLADDPPHVDLVARPIRQRPSRVGLQLERQFVSVVVASVELGGLLADKAGVMVGDYLVNAGGLLPVRYLLERATPGLDD